MTTRAQLTPADLPIVIITPVYEDQPAFQALSQDLMRHFGPNLTLVVVDDGSIMQPIDLADFPTSQTNGYILRLRRNVGHQRAISVGLAYVMTNVPKVGSVVIMDSDGEDSPASIQSLLSELDHPDVDIAVAQRASRVESWNFKLFYWLYKAIFKGLTGRVISFGNFMAMKPTAAARLSSMAESPIHLAASVLNARLRVRRVAVHRAGRYAGQSKMNFVGLVLHGFRGMMVFAEDVLVRVGIACGLVASMSLLMILAAVALKAAGIATPGWFSVALGLLVLIFIQTGTLVLLTLLMTGNLKANQSDPTSQNLALIKEVVYTAKRVPK